jgi:hypothetical protein
LTLHLTRCCWQIVMPSFAVSHISFAILYLLFSFFSFIFPSYLHRLPGIKGQGPSGRFAGPSVAQFHHRLRHLYFLRSWIFDLVVSENIRQARTSSAHQLMVWLSAISATPSSMVACVSMQRSFFPLSRSSTQESATCVRFDCRGPLHVIMLCRHEYATSTSSLCIRRRS